MQLCKNKQLTKQLQSIALIRKRAQINNICKKYITVYYSLSREG